MPLPTPACNVERMYPHFFSKGGGEGREGEGRGGEERGGEGRRGEGRGNCQAFVKKIALFYEGIIILTSQGL